jgi:hypothetical protein
MSLCRLRLFCHTTSRSAVTHSSRLGHPGYDGLDGGEWLTDVRPVGLTMGVAKDLVAVVADELALSVAK